MAENSYLEKRMTQERSLKEVLTNKSNNAENEFLSINEHFSNNIYTREYFNDLECPEVNRYANVLTYNLTAVTTDGKEPTCKNFLNANYIPSFKDAKEKSVFIAAQAPLPSTVSAFLSVVYRLPIFLVITILGENELDNSKAHQNFWAKPLQINEISISTFVDLRYDEQNMAIRKIDLRQFQNPKNRSFYHIHVRWWPDKGVVPHENYQDLKDLLELINLVEKKAHGLTLIHCSAGIGRTGTLIAAYFIWDYFMNQKNQEKAPKISIKDLIMHLRKYRPHMVQTLEQYKFLYDFYLSLYNKNPAN